MWRLVRKYYYPTKYIMEAHLLLESLSKSISLLQLPFFIWSVNANKSSRRKNSFLVTTTAHTTQERSFVRTIFTLGTISGGVLVLLLLLFY